MTNKQSRGFVVRCAIFVIVLVVMFAFDAYWFRPVPVTPNNVVLNQFTNAPAVIIQHSSRGAWITWAEIGTAVFAALTLFGQEIVSLVKNDK